jgi:hypothetical protein
VSDNSDLAHINGNFRKQGLIEISDRALKIYNPAEL